MTRVGCLVLLMGGSAIGCGEETALLVTLDLSSFSVPTELDLVHLELRDEDGPVIGRDFAPEEKRPVYRLLPGSRTPSSFGLIAYAYLGGVPVTQSEERRTRFREGEMVRLTLVLPRP